MYETEFPEPAMKSEVNIKNKFQPIVKKTQKQFKSERKLQILENTNKFAEIEEQVSEIMNKLDFEYDDFNKMSENIEMQDERAKYPRPMSCQDLRED